MVPIWRYFFIQIKIDLILISDIPKPIMNTMMKDFGMTFFLTFIGLALSIWLGYNEGGTWMIGLQFLFTTSILALLETTISFDNAIVNASILKKMTPLWQRRFLTWGIIIAVFGMRLVFPIVIVCLAASLGPIAAVQLALKDPAKYAEIMLSVHPQVASFGGAFLALVALSYFFNVEKEIHWITFIEKRLARLGAVKSTEIGLTLLGILTFSRYVDPEISSSVLFSGVAGILTFIGVKLIGEVLSLKEEGTVDIAKQSFGLFLYLEILDASFSFDGVIAAFAITSNPLIIALGLGIGALYVRSFTITMVHRGSLDNYVFLEHGAFWAIALLAVVMFVSISVHVPETISGGLGLLIISTAFIHSLVHKRKVVARKSQTA